MRHYQTIRAAALLTAGVAALSLGACNKNSASQNGAYVAGSTDSSLPLSSQPLPPSNEYQQVANTPPPPLPVYDQPPIPGDGYVWTPGYWDWSDDDDDYYWVPGAWVEPPEPGVYWTPGYWRYYDGRYLYSDGYWGPEVGYYGGVDYGYGYGGEGYAGGRWQGDRFLLQQPGEQFRRPADCDRLQPGRGDQRQPGELQRRARRPAGGAGPGRGRRRPDAPHGSSTRVPVAAARMARAEPQRRASVNGGAPPIAATSRPAAFRAGGRRHRLAVGGQLRPARGRGASWRAGLARRGGQAAGRASRRDAGTRARTGRDRPRGAGRTAGAGVRADPDPRAGRAAARRRARA